MYIKKLLVGVTMFGVMLGVLVVPSLAASPNADADCDTNVFDPFSGQSGTRAEVYGCKSIGNSKEEQGIYTIETSSANLGYTENHGMCKVLVKWSGDYGMTPYLDYGRVYNKVSCDDGYVEIWGDQFDAEDAYGATPYVYTIKGEGDLVHRNNPS